MAGWLSAAGVGGAAGALAGLALAARRLVERAAGVEAALARLAGRPEAAEVRAELRALAVELAALRRAAEAVGRAFRFRRGTGR